MGSDLLPARLMMLELHNEPCCYDSQTHTTAEQRRPPCVCACVRGRPTHSLPNPDPMACQKRAPGKRTKTLTNVVAHIGQQPGETGGWAVE